MTPDVFSEGQIFLVTVEDASQDSDRQAKSGAEVYSRVVQFKGVTSAGHANLESSNLESRNELIKNQPIKFGIQVVRRATRAKRPIDRTQRFVESLKLSKEIA